MADLEGAGELRQLVADLDRLIRAHADLWGAVAGDTFRRILDLCNDDDAPSDAAFLADSIRIAIAHSLGLIDDHAAIQMMRQAYRQRTGRNLPA